MEAERSYWERRLAESNTLSGVGWLGLGEPFNRWMYRVRRWVFLRRIRPLLSGSPKDVLDVGTGSGFYIERWLELGPARSRVRISPTPRWTALRQRFPGQRFVRLDIGADGIPLERGAFDAISAMDMLFHLTDDQAYERAIGNLAEMLRPGGLLVFTENSYTGPPGPGRTR